MISRGVVVWLGIAIFTGICLFLVKYQVRQLEERLLALNERVVANQDATHILKAEWANLNDIGRIDQLSVKFLKLQPMSTAQLGTVESLPMRREPLAPPAMPQAVPAAPSPVAQAAPSVVPAGATPAAATPAAAPVVVAPPMAQAAPNKRYDSIDQLLKNGAPQ